MLLLARTSKHLTLFVQNDHMPSSAASQMWHPSD